ncbi:Cysteine--tRNA ligase, mitochondrial [Balamuthia mandrillaris]
MATCNAACGLLRRSGGRHGVPATLLPLRKKKRDTLLLAPSSLLGSSSNERMANSSCERREYSSSNWQLPRGKATGVHVHNSLTNSMVPLVVPTDRPLSWYTCGPTVYESSHLGHARNYVSVDVVLRLLRHFFNVPVQHAMGMTDIDDKIMAKAAALQAAGHGSTASSFLDIARKYEEEFWDDLDAFAVERPAAVVRVTEHIPEIIAFVQRIMEQGCAYQTPSGVYFSVGDFENTKANDQSLHVYKMAPSGGSDTVNNGEASETEGALGKRHARDFALWKAAKEGEPFWEAPWGKGRPGWHIECSAMSCMMFGEKLDVHAGGIDLKFPHHCNEAAQCEAHWGSSQWANYFLHTGHLHIAGHKMSKSLKNFITTKEFFERGFTAKQFRLFCLLHRYSKNVEFSERYFEEKVKPTEKKIEEFFMTIESLLREAKRNDARQAEVKRWDDPERKLFACLSEAERKVRESLQDNFNTETALEEGILQLIINANLYMHNNPSRMVAHSDLLASISYFVSHFFGACGLDFASGATSASSEVEARFVKVTDVLVDFRRNVRTAVLKSKDSRKDVLQLCDSVRDELLPPLGIRLEDKSQGAGWKLERPPK